MTETLSPLSIVEQSSFKELLVYLNPAVVMLSRYMVKESQRRCDGIRCDLIGWPQLLIAAWTAQHRSFLGVTAHWLNKKSMKRKPAALACRRLTGKHDYLLLGKEICKVHDQFEITENVVGTTTDNGSNFVKAFLVFSPSGDENGDYQKNVSVSDSLDSGLIDEPELPPHYRCAAHTLNLIATISNQHLLPL